jgi:hypothetical protein
MSLRHGKDIGMTFYIFLSGATRDLTMGRKRSGDP